MPRADPNLARLELVATRLQHLRDEVVFLGGAVVGLLASDDAAPDPRPTEDVDFVVDVASTGKFLLFERELQRLGFEPDTSRDAPRCRYLVEDLKVDVMPTDSAILGFANRWARSATRSPLARVLRTGLAIQHVDGPHFLATKIEAFNGRGRGDFLFSHDVEDIIAVIDGRPSIVGEVRDCGQDELRVFIATALGRWSSRFGDIVQAHLLPDDASQRRAPLVISRLHELMTTS